MREFDMIVYSVIIEYVFHPLRFVLLWLYLMSVKLQFREYLQVKSSRKKQAGFRIWLSFIGKTSKKIKAEIDAVSV